VTLTINPSIDVSTTVKKIEPLHKLRSSIERRQPGGRGVNVARVVRRFGGDVLAIYAADGVTGQRLRQLIANEGLQSLTFPISGDTRENFNIFEEATGREYRFMIRQVAAAALANGERERLMWEIQHAGEVLDWNFDWRDWLAVGDQIVSSTWTVRPQGPTLANPTLDVPLSFTGVTVSDLEAGLSYELINRVETFSRTGERTMVLRCVRA
jgi:hypothetical protein